MSPSGEKSEMLPSERNRRWATQVLKDNKSRPRVDFLQGYLKICETMMVRCESLIVVRPHIDILSEIRQST
jgi:hypothetical protein